jgi:nucleoside-diphosphate-sugar epimerase
MRILVVGATGFIGSQLLQRARERGHDAIGTTRKREDDSWLCHYDLLDPLAGKLPPCDVAFLCAGVANYEKCEGNREAWRINADGNIAAGKRLMRAGAFVVFLSSAAAEFAGNFNYARAKIAVELVLQAAGDPAIVRFERVTAESIAPVCEALLAIGLARKPGIFRIPV